MSENELMYIGGELGLFAHAQKWKAYWSALVRPYLKGEVLEVGAGIGSNTCLLRTAEQKRWVCLEPDPALLNCLRKTFEESSPMAPCEPLVGTMQNVEPREQFDSIVYIDVLEHIADDRAELAGASQRLKPGGHLVVLAPAHQWLFSKFDQSIGHYRRYTKGSLLAAAPSGFKVKRVVYLDSFGLFLSLCNRLFLRQSLPTKEQILFWDRKVIPVSKVVDPLLFYSFGKSVVAVWTKEAA